MAYWLAKQEPSGPRGYPIDQLKRDGMTVWDGVGNNLALKHMRSMKKGDKILYYHTGTERRAVGVMEVVRGPYPDPQRDGERWTVVDVKYVKHLKNPVTLEAIKAEPEFAGWDLLRISRLSIVPVPPKIWRALIAMSGKAAAR